MVTERMETVRRSPKVDGPQVGPQPGGQDRFLATIAFEALFGGQAGPGKSWALVYDALGIQFLPLLGRPACHLPGYKAVIFRRETGQLAELIGMGMDMYRHWGGDYAAARRGEPGVSFTFPTSDPGNPARIFFCHLEHEQDKENHHGIAYQYIGFDEVTTFSLTQYLYLFTRCRSTIPGVWPRIRSTTNPVGPGLWWVRKRFIHAKIEDRAKFFLAAPEPERDPCGVEVPPDTKFALSRIFIPGKLSENLVLMQNDPMYPARIMAQGQRMANALLNGDWDAFGGEFFAGFSVSQNVVPPFLIPSEWPLIGSIDPGFSSPCSFGLCARAMNGKVYRIFTYYEAQRNAEQHAEAIKKRIKECEYTKGRWPDIIVSGKDAWAKRDQYAVTSSTVTFADVFRGHDIILVPANTDRKAGWWAWRLLLPNGKMANRYFLFDGMNEPAIDEMIAAVPDPKDEEDILGKGNDPSVKDHFLDDQRYSLMAMPKSPEPTPLPDLSSVIARILGGVSGQRKWEAGDG